LWLVSKNSPIFGKIPGHYGVTSKFKNDQTDFSQRW
jgi:hypothetical protein